MCFYYHCVLVHVLKYFSEHRGVMNIITISKWLCYLAILRSVMSVFIEWERAVAQMANNK